jgi:hypothetical protein
MKLLRVCVCGRLEIHTKNHVDLHIAKKNASTFEELNRKSSLIRLQRQRQIKDIYLGKLLFILFIHGLNTFVIAMSIMNE